jgi:hypothetical protein
MIQLVNLFTYLVYYFGKTGQAIFDNNKLLILLTIYFILFQSLSTLSYSIFLPTSFCPSPVFFFCNGDKCREKKNINSSISPTFEENLLCKMSISPTFYEFIYPGILAQKKYTHKM